MIVFVIGVGSPSVPAQSGEFSNATLKGISTVYVLVESLSNGAKGLGLSKDIIQTDAELKLRLAGIRVVTQKESRTFKIPGSPHIYINVTSTDSAMAASIHVELGQNVQLERNGEFAPGVTTWSTGYLFLNPNAQAIRDKIKDKVDEFLNAWLSVNPKK